MKELAAAILSTLGTSYLLLPDTSAFCNHGASLTVLLSRKYNHPQVLGSHYDD